MRLLKCLILLFVLQGESLLAQNMFNMKGFVQDEAGNPLRNVELMIVDTRIKTKSDKKGEFTLKKIQLNDSVRVIVDKAKAAQFVINSNANAVVTVYVDAVTLMIGNESLMHCALRELSPEEREEKRDMITDRMIARNNILSLEQAIREFFPGVQMTESTEGTKVRMRGGATSINQQSEALVILDGAETTFDTAMNSISIYDVESIQVEKDGIGYGLRGTGGVIIITTKN